VCLVSSVALLVVLCCQYETWSVGRLGRYEKRRGREVTEDEEDECNEAKFEIVENRICSVIVVPYVLN